MIADLLQCYSIVCLALGRKGIIHRVIFRIEEEESGRKVTTEDNLKFGRARRNWFSPETDICTSYAFVVRHFLIFWNTQ
jgi:hypothetical protein